MSIKRVILVGCSYSSTWGKFIAPNAYISKEETSEISDLTFYLMEIEREEQIKTKVVGKQGIEKKSA